MIATNVWNAFAPSTRAASSASSDSLWSPARTISIMNGVHSQTSTKTTDGIAKAPIQFTWCTPNGERT